MKWLQPIMPLAKSLLQKAKSCECCVDFQCFNQRTLSFSTEPVACFVNCWRWLALEAKRCCFCTQLNKLSVVSVVLTFIASLSPYAPSSLILLPALALMLKLCPCLTLSDYCKLSRNSSVNVVLAFNASPRAHAPFAPIPFPALIFACIFWFHARLLLDVTAHLQDEVFSVVCWLLMLRSVHMLLHRRSCCLLSIAPDVVLMFDIFVLLLQASQAECCECCVDLQCLAQGTCTSIADLARCFNF